MMILDRDGTEVSSPQHSPVQPAASFARDLIDELVVDHQALADQINARVEATLRDQAQHLRAVLGPWARSQTV